MRKPLLLTVALVLGAGGLTLAASSGASAATADACAGSDPFTAADVAALDADYAGRHLAIAVADATTGCRYRYGSDEWFPTASTAKLEIMGAVFLALQDEGATEVPAWTAPVLQAMIQWSDNDAADDLYDWLGGGGALQQYGQRLGLTNTDNTSHDWGGTATTPDDQLALLQTVVVGGGVLASRWVDLARSYLASVDSSQRWGVTAGAPAGSTVWLKDGWYDNDGSLWGPGAAWRLGSIGVVQLPNGRRYSIAVYVDDDPSITSGIATIERLAAHVAATMAAIPPPLTATMADVTATPSVTTAFTPQSPTRLLDTRTAGGRIGGDTVAVVAVPSPASGAPVVAAALEVTAVDPLADGYVTAYADGGERPLASDLNPLRGRITANLVITPVGADGRVQLFSSAPVDLVVDLVGTFAAATGPVAAGRLVTVDPVRVLDTRTTTGPVAAGSVTRVDVAGRGAVPVAGVAAVAVTVTATDVAAAGYWTVWPGDGAVPLASTLDAAPGDTVGNTTLVPVASDGTVSVFSQSGGSLVVDVVGWVTDGTAAPATAGRIAIAAAPVRIVDTRIGLGGTRLAGDGVTTFATGLGAGATGLLADLATVDPDAAGYLTVYGAGTARPATSTTNSTPDRDPVAVATATGLTGGRFDVYAKTGVDVVVDLWGWLTS